MDPALQLLFRQRIPLDNSAPRTIRFLIGGFRPLLGPEAEDTVIAGNELATAYLQHGSAESFEFRLYAGDDRFRIELLDSMLSEASLTTPQDEVGKMRLKVLNGVTESWGVLGDGISLVWFELRRAREAATEALRGEM